MAKKRMKPNALVVRNAAPSHPSIIPRKAMSAATASIHDTRFQRLFSFAPKFVIERKKEVNNPAPCKFIERRQEHHTLIAIRIPATGLVKRPYPAANPRTSRSIPALFGLRVADPAVVPAISKINDQANDEP